MNSFAKENVFLLTIVPMIALPLTIIPLACSQDLRRRVPHNFILLGIFTFAESLTIGVLVAWSPGVALRAFIITTAMVFGLTLFAFQTKIDFTILNGFMFCALLIFSVVGLLMLFFPTGRLNTVYAGFGVLIFSIYLLIDTQMLTGGNHKYQISPEDYIFAALTIYMDIIQIFLYIMQILAASDK
jgi:FtsH-binding integral membrane protein